MKRTLFLLLMAGLFTHAHGLAFADSAIGEARLVPLPLKTKTNPSETPKIIDGLSFDPPTAEIRLSQNRKIVARITGRLPNQEGSLILNFKRYTILTLRGEEGRFEFEIPLSGASTEFELMTVSPWGEVKRQQTLIYFDGWDRAQRELKTQHSKTLFSGLETGLSITSLAFSETAVGNYDEVTLTAKAGYHHTLYSPSWEWSASGFATLLPLFESYPASARFFGANFKIGYHVPKFTDPWQLKVWLGGYYTTMIVTNNLFGYQNVIGPEFYTSLQKNLASGDGLQGYFKFAMVSNDIPNFAISNHEIALGLAYSHPLTNGHPLSASFEGSVFSLLSNASQITVSTISLGAGYGF